MYVYNMYVHVHTCHTVHVYLFIHLDRPLLPPSPKTPNVFDNL